MPTTCTTGVNIPTLLTPECDGDFKSTKCSLHPDAIPLFNFPIGTPNYDIIIAQNLAIKSNRDLIDVVNNIAEVNTTITPLTLTQLIIAYPTAIVGKKVIAQSINQMYEKTLTGWISYAINTVI